MDSGLSAEIGWVTAYGTGQSGRYGENGGGMGRKGEKWGDSDARGVPSSTGGASRSASWLLERPRFAPCRREAGSFYASHSLELRS